MIFAGRHPDFLGGFAMIDTETRAMLRTILDEVCGHVGQYQNATRAHVAAQMLAAARREVTIENIRTVGREALKSAPTMWR
jgi:uncharacterized protein (DUF2267 family)